MAVTSIRRTQDPLVAAALPGFNVVAVAILLGAILIGGNVYHRVALVLGWGCCAYAVLIMAFLQTDANIVNASMINVITLIVLGLIVLTAGLYGKVGTAEAARAEEAAPHGGR